jgi:23S rRNA (uridine2552-2'-O)-methyltransferase
MSKPGGDKPNGGESGRPSARRAAVRVHTAANRSISSARWLQRQLNDPYVAEAQRLGYRSRAAFKLIQLDDRHHLLKPGMTVVDLGAAPGGWTQVAIDRVRADRPNGGKVLALDIQEMAPITHALVLNADFHDNATPGILKDALGGPADLVLSDMAAPATGHQRTDHLRIVNLCDAALEFAEEVLKPGGGFVAKLFQGGAERGLLDRLKRDFEHVRHTKPPASRAESSELYLVATGFRGAVVPDDDGDAG